MNVRIINSDLDITGIECEVWGCLLMKNNDDYIIDGFACNYQ